MLSFVEVKPDFVFSQYEISIIKSIWRSLDLNNPLNLKDFIIQSQLLLIVLVQLPPMVLLVLKEINLHR